MKSKLYQMIGHKYGMLTIEKVFKNGRTKQGSNKWYLKAVCDCGKHHITHAHSVKAGRTTSCGCRRDQYQKNSGENHPNFTGYKEIRGKTYSTIKRRANERGLNFNLPIEFLWELYEKQNYLCALSGIEITWFDKTMSGYEGGKRCTVSVDRIDSNKGYTKNNVQLVHKEVNIMKNVFSQKHFIDMCSKIANYSQGKQ